MKIDMDYLKRLLEAFEASKLPFSTIFDLQKELGCKILSEDREADETEDAHLFVFHMSILNDKHLIEQVDGDVGFGLKTTMRGNYRWVILPLRLTAEGHEFIEVLRNKEVWATLKSGFKDASIATLTEAGKALFTAYAKKKAQDLTGLQV